MLMRTTTTRCYPIAREEFLGRTETMDISAFQKESSKRARGRVGERDIPAAVGSSDGVKFGKRGNDGIIQRQLVHRTLRHASIEKTGEEEKGKERERELLQKETDQIFLWSRSIFIFAWGCI